MVNTQQPPSTQNPSAIVLETNNRLLNPNFEGYRLQTNPIPSYSIDFKGHDVCSGTVSQNAENTKNPLIYNMDYILSCTGHNYLTVHPNDPNAVYFIDSSGNIKVCCVRLDSCLPVPKTVAKMNFKKAESGLSAPCLHFTKPENTDTPTLAISSNGAQQIFVFSTRWFL